MIIINISSDTMLIQCTFIWGTITALTSYYYNIPNEQLPLFIGYSISMTIIITINIISSINEINELKTTTRSPLYNIISSPIGIDLPSPKNNHNSGQVNDISSINGVIVNYTCFSHDLSPEQIVIWLEKYYNTELRPNGGIVTHHTEQIRSFASIRDNGADVNDENFSSEYPNSQKMRIVVYKYGSGSFVTTSRWGNESDTIIFNNEYRRLVSDIGGKKEIYYPKNIRH